MSHIKVQYHFVKLLYHVCTCTVSHIVKWISYSASGWEKMRKLQKQKEMYYFLEDKHSLSRKGFMTKPNRTVAQLRPLGFWRYLIAFGELPLYTGNTGAFFSVPYMAEVTLATWVRERCRMRELCAAPCLTTFFNQVQVTFL